MSPIGFPPLSSSQISQANGVSPQNPVGSVGDKTVQENDPPVLNDSKVLHDNKQPRKTLIGNHGLSKKPTSGGSAISTFASFRKSTTSTQATPQNQSAEISKTPRPSFSSIKNQSSSGGERGQAMIGENCSMPQTQAQSELEKHESKPQVEPKTTEQTQTTSGVENANRTEEKSLIDKFKKFSSKISQKLDTLIAKAKEGKDEIKAKMLGYDKAINEKFGDALNTKLFTFEEKKALVDFITRSSVETEKDLNDVIRYETNSLRSALLKVLSGKIPDGVDKQTFEELKKHGGSAYEDNVYRWDPLNRDSTPTHGNIKETTLGLCELYKKYVDPQAFPKPEKKTIDTSDLNETEAKMVNLLSSFANDQSDADLKIFAKILTTGSNLTEKYPENKFIANFSKYTGEKLEQAYQIIQQNPELTYKEFEEKCAEQILKGGSGLKKPENLADDKKSGADDAQKIKKTSQNNQKSSVETSKTQSHKPTQDKPPVKLQTSVQAPKAQTQVLTPGQTELRNECNQLVYSSWGNRSIAITAALTRNCPSEEKLQEFKQFFMENYDNEALVKTKVYELTGQQIP